MAFSIEVLTDALRKVNRIYQIEILGKGGESTCPSFQVHTLNKVIWEAGQNGSVWISVSESAPAGRADR